jgi:hypothetical protein
VSQVLQTTQHSHEQTIIGFLNIKLNIQMDSKELVMKKIKKTINPLYITGQKIARSQAAGYITLCELWT